MASALCYLLGPITGILFLVIEPHNKSAGVRFHAWQSILFSLAWIVFWIGMAFLTGALSFVGLLLLPFELLIGLAGFCFWLFLMWKAYQGQKFVIPIVGPIAEQQAAGVR
jgi:uncharacterized membrane protein